MKALKISHPGKNMSFSFVSHHVFPNDQYVRELVYLCFDNKYRVAYTRKQGKNGGLFWSPASIGVQHEGSKVFFESFLQDSNFLEKDIRNFLDNRLWEKSSAQSPQEPESKSDDFPF